MMTDDEFARFLEHHRETMTDEQRANFAALHKMSAENRRHARRYRGAVWFVLAGNLVNLAICAWLDADAFMVAIAAMQAATTALILYVLYKRRY